MIGFSHKRLTFLALHVTASSKHIQYAPYQRYPRLQNLHTWHILAPSLSGHAIFAVIIHDSWWRRRLLHFVGGFYPSANNYALSHRNFELVQQGLDLDSARIWWRWDMRVEGKGGGLLVCCWHGGEESVRGKGVFGCVREGEEEGMVVI